MFQLFIWRRFYRVFWGICTCIQHQKWSKMLKDKIMIWSRVSLFARHAERNKEMLILHVSSWRNGKLSEKRLSVSRWTAVDHSNSSTSVSIVHASAHASREELVASSFFNFLKGLGAFKRPKLTSLVVVINLGRSHGSKNSNDCRKFHVLVWSFRLWWFWREDSQVLYSCNYHTNRQNQPGGRKRDEFS